MATSGSIIYGATRDDIITESLELCGVIGEGETPSTAQLASCSRALNFMLKFWIADGMNLWVNQELVVFPVKDQRQYTFGATGDRMVLESGLVTTKLNGALANGATALTVDSTTGMATSDIIGVVTDDAGIHWTTIATIPDSTSLTITQGVDSTCADNDRVYTYTTVFAERITSINNAWARSTDEIDIPIKLVGREEYVSLSDKTENGRVNQIYFDPQLTTSLANVWPVPNDLNTNERLYMYVTRVYEDLDQAADDVAFPQEWFLPIAWGLSMYIAPKYGVSEHRYNEILNVSAALKRTAELWSVEQQSVFLTPARHN